METTAAGLTRVQESGFFSSASQNRYYLGGVGAAALILLVLLILEIRKTRKKAVRIRTEGNGRARIGVDSVMQSLAYRIDELPGVRDAKPRVTSRGNDVDIAIDLHTSPTVNVPGVTAQIVNLAHEIIETQLGVKIHGKVQVNVAHEPFPRGTMAPAAAPTAPSGAAKPAKEPERVVIPPVTMQQPRPAAATRSEEASAERPSAGAPSASKPSGQ